MSTVNPKTAGSETRRGPGGLAHLLPRTADLTRRQFAQISALARSVCGLNLHSRKRELVKARLHKRLRQLQLDSFDEYLDYLRSDASADELVAMLDALVTNVTSFFRHVEQFEYLVGVVLPRKIAGAAESGRRLRIWSAGCSTGEEAYSIAIAVAETVPHIGAWDVAILATALSTGVLRRASDGVYTAERLRPIPLHLRGKYFTRVQARPKELYRVRENIRPLVHFRRLNLMGLWPMRGTFDVIFCRNVMIYFDKATQDRLIERLREVLAPGGTVFVGHSESLTNPDRGFRYVRPAIYEKP
ncbi:hypothetical protein LCGC14_1764210 [marine sediment metagenome]|uniref:protein-glutamate O-methyltransferase n=1 Tax=marine sediment metagenome TaxID=412755 RepID=A0A0F9HML9_9ZZZZ